MKPWTCLPAIALLLASMLAHADDPPGLPKYVTVLLAENPISAPPRLRVSFKNTATQYVGFELEALANGERIEQVDLAANLHCSNRNDMACNALMWWLNPETQQYINTPDTTEGFELGDLAFDTDYCFRIRVFTEAEPDGQNWSKQVCKHTPPVPPVPAAPVSLTDTFTQAAEKLAWSQPDYHTVASFRLNIYDGNSSTWLPLGEPFDGNHGIPDQTASVPQYGGPQELHSLRVYRVCAINMSGSTCSAAAARPPGSYGGPTGAPAIGSTVEMKDDHSTIAALVQPAPKALGRVTPTTAPGSTGLAGEASTVAFARVPTTGAPPPICDAAKSARARNSPAAPGLEKQCTTYLAAHPALPPLDPARIETLATVGSEIAAIDPDVAAARSAVADGDYQRGFDIATGLFGDPALGAQGNTLMGPGSAQIRDSLPASGQRGFNDSVKFHLARTYR
jgi:hypothetical protein